MSAAAPGLGAWAKYRQAYALGLADALQRRASLVMDRLGGFALVCALYFFWSAVARGGDGALGYTRSQMLTYVLLMNLLRALVLTGRGWELVREISSGRIASALLRPIDYRGYSLALDLSGKSLHAAAACLELALLIALFSAPVYFPGDLWRWPLFLACAALAALCFFLMEFLVSSLAFWTSESAGPLFCFELFLQFASGAFFPLDVLPAFLRGALAWTPFPYLVFFPIQVYLERAAPARALAVLALELLWALALAAACGALWRRGLAQYSAEGG